MTARAIPQKSCVLSILLTIDLIMGSTAKWKEHSHILFLCFVKITRVLGWLPDG